MTSWLDRKIRKARRRDEPAREGAKVLIKPKASPGRPRRNLAIDEPPPPMRRRATAREIIRWIETRCYIPEGKLIGRPFRLASWQKDEIRRIYDNPDPRHTRRAILSFARKNGKTALAALLMLVHLIGPMAIANSQLFSSAQSREQASLIFALAAKIVRMSPELRGSVTVKDSTKELTCPELGTRYRALSADATTAYGLSPVFLIHDELGQVRGPRSELYEALETATGAQEEPLSVIISTQAPTDADLLSILIDDALAGHDPRTVVSLYTAPVTLDPFAEETIRLANPAFGNFLNSVEVMDMADAAKRMPSREAQYRNLVLNQRVEASQRFVSPADWKACAGPVGDLTQCDAVYGGLDLSAASDLTAFVLIGKIDDKWHMKPTFWLPSDGIHDRAKTDHVPYDLWASQGYLETIEGNSIDYDKVAKRVHEMISTLRVKKIAFDRWNFQYFKPWLLLYYGEMWITEHFVEFGQGTQSMSPALREFESQILNRKIAHGDHPILNMCAANAVVESKDEANRKLSKKKSVGRIDGMVAATMAIGVAPVGAPNVDISALIG